MGIDVYFEADERRTDESLASAFETAGAILVGRDAAGIEDEEWSAASQDAEPIGGRQCRRHSRGLAATRRRKRAIDAWLFAGTAIEAKQALHTTCIRWRRGPGGSPGAILTTKERHESKHLGRCRDTGAAMSVSGCAIDPAIQQRAAAFAIGGTAVAPDQVGISNQTLTPDTPGYVSRWHASVPSGEYDCSAVLGESGLLVQTVCVKK